MKHTLAQLKRDLMRAKTVTLIDAGDPIVVVGNAGNTTLGPHKWLGIPRKIVKAQGYELVLETITPEGPRNSYLRWPKSALVNYNGVDAFSVSDGYGNSLTYSIQFNQVVA